MEFHFFSIFVFFLNALYQEKVARRDIGKLAFPKKVSGRQPVVVCEKRDVKGRYIRKGIDFNQLDALGAGGIRSRQVQMGGQMKNIQNQQRAMSTTSSGSGSRDIQSHYSTVVVWK